jgi:2-succinyl-5-enolpyruvyl-6-hydroxy-3-cyclohexene-1-carboxylate synthase
MTDELALTGWVRLLADSLAEAGVRYAVLSPGSRSTPLAWALLEHPALVCRTVLDERSAGFLAVGWAKMTGSPSLVLSTSGTAPANYLPSVVESSNSGTPLIVLTADRPWELMDALAPQTTDQLRLFGAYARAYVELGLPEIGRPALRGLRRRVLQAVLSTRWPRPGPVQLNARLRKPLEPADAREEPEPPVHALGDAGPTRVYLPVRTPDAAAIELVARECRGAERGLILCGAALPWHAVNPEALAELGEATGFVVVAETTSQVRFALGRDPRVTLCDGFEPLFRSAAFRRAWRPDCVLEFGAPLLSAGWELCLRESPTLRRHAVAAVGWPDPYNTLSSLTIAEPTLVARALAARLGTTSALPAKAAWRASMAHASRLAWSAVEAETGRSWGESLAVRTVLESLPPGTVLALGSSLPLREVDLCGRAGPTDVQVWSQRGTNGIDGLLSGALGAALGSGRPTTLLVGDLGFLHDVGGLWAARDLELPLAIVVLNNRGGRIFEQLPVARAENVARYFDQHWVLGHTLDLSAITRGFGLRAERIDGATELRAELGQALTRPGATVLEVVLPPESARDFVHAVVTRVDQALLQSEAPPLAGPTP